VGYAAHPGKLGGPAGHPGGGLDHLVDVALRVGAPGNGQTNQVHGGRVSVPSGCGPNITVPISQARTPPSWYSAQAGAWPGECSGSRRASRPLVPYGLRALQVDRHLRDRGQQPAARKGPENDQTSRGGYEQVTGSDPHALVTRWPPWVRRRHAGAAVSPPDPWPRLPQHRVRIRRCSASGAGRQPSGCRCPYARGRRRIRSQPRQ
jgi:hypothetical protein